MDVITFPYWDWRPMKAIATTVWEQKIVNTPNISVLQGLYSLSGKTSYRQISWSLEAARLDVAMVVSLWNLTGTSAAAL